MNARVLATVPACLVLVLAASLFATPSAHAQCADWEAGPLDNGIAANGANGSVYCSTLWDPDGAGPIPAELVIGGAFTSIDGVPAHHLAIRDAYTGAWSELGGGVGTIALSLTTWNGMLVVGGTGDNYPDTPDNNVLGWNGSTWVSFNEGTSTGNVWALAVLNGELYAAGNFVIYPTTGDPAYNIAHWNSARNLFDPVAGPGTDPGENVNCLTTWNGSLWAGTYWHDYLGSAKGSV
jgi:hypothetical protein